MSEETKKPAETPSDAPQPKSGQSVGQAVKQGVVDAFAPVISAIDTIGGHIIMAARAFSWLPRRPFRGRSYLESMDYIGFGSLPVVLLVGLFTGMVTALQSVQVFREFGLTHLAGGTTGVSIAAELGPVLTSLMLAGRVGAGIATEIGTMRISEQIDALESMAVNPIQFLVLPRIVAGLLMTPILVLLFFIISMGGAYLIAVVKLGEDAGLFIYHFEEMVSFIEVMKGLMKGCVFGFTITLVGCYYGFNASGGGRGVGIATTKAVVISSVSVLVLDYFVTELLLVIFPVGS
ncbi:MAG: ABC transporter permease [Kofleriaceae bacterium]|nr:ABC transporter permease [Kofleriaceae bacterium]